MTVKSKGFLNPESLCLHLHQVHVCNLKVCSISHRICFLYIKYLSRDSNEKWKCIANFKFVTYFNKK